MRKADLSTHCTVPSLCHSPNGTSIEMENRVAVSRERGQWKVGVTVTLKREQEADLVVVG